MAALARSNTSMIWEQVRRAFFRRWLADPDRPLFPHSFHRFVVSLVTSTTQALLGGVLNLHKKPEAALKLIVNASKQDSFDANVLFEHDTSQRVVRFGRTQLPAKAAQIMPHCSTILDLAWSPEIIRQHSNPNIYRALRTVLRNCGALCTSTENERLDRMEQQHQEHHARQKQEDVAATAAAAAAAVTAIAEPSPTPMMTEVPPDPLHAPTAVIPPLEDSWRLMVNGMALPSGDPILGSTAFTYDAPREMWRIVMPSSVLPANGLPLTVTLSTTTFGANVCVDNHRRFDVEACILPRADAVEGEAPWTFQLVSQLNPKVQQSSVFSLTWAKAQGEVPFAVVFYVIARPDTVQVTKPICHELDCDYQPMGFAQRSMPTPPLSPVQTFAQPSLGYFVASPVQAVQPQYQPLPPPLSGSPQQHYYPMVAPPAPHQHQLVPPKNSRNKNRNKNKNHHQNHHQNQNQNYYPGGGGGGGHGRNNGGRQQGRRHNSPISGWGRVPSYGIGVPAQHWGMQ